MARPPLPGRAGSLGDPHGLWRPWSHPTACARLPVARFGCGGTGLPTPSCLQLPAQGRQAQPHARGGHTRSCVCKHKRVPPRLCGALHMHGTAESPARARGAEQSPTRTYTRAALQSRAHANTCARATLGRALYMRAHVWVAQSCARSCTCSVVRAQTRTGCARKRMHCTEPCSHACVCIHTLPPVQTHGALFMHTHTCIHTTLPCTPTEPCSHTHTCIYTHPPPTHNPGALHSPTAAPTPTPLAAASPLLLF